MALLGHAGGRTRIGETLQHHRDGDGLEPYAYLRLIFEGLPQATTLADIEALLPWAVKAAGAKPTR